MAERWCGRAKAAGVQSTGFEEDREAEWVLVEPDRMSSSHHASQTRAVLVNLEKLWNSGTQPPQSAQGLKHSPEVTCPRTY